jgi:hypothetical protein
MCNQRIGDRLALLVTTLLAEEDSTLFVPQIKADELSRTFGSPFTVAGALSVLPVN